MMTMCVSIVYAHRLCPKSAVLLMPDTVSPTPYERPMRRLAEEECIRSEAMALQGPQAAGPSILVVDDEVAIGKVLRDFLEAEGFGVLVSQDGETALATLARTSVACILLDIMMPGADGFDICRQIRTTTDVPILFLTAREGESDKLRGFRLGGDDYIVKSATPDEVVARVKAVLRRARPASAAAAPAQDESVLDFGRLVLDVRAHEVRVEGVPVAMPAREFALL